MASALITKHSDFNVSAVSYGAAKTNARGGKSIKVMDAKKNPLVLQTPLILTWGVNKLVDEDSGRVSYTVSLQFPSENYGTPASHAFFEKMRDLEDKILDDAVANSKSWFGKSKMTREVAEALFTPMLRYPKDKLTGEPDYDRAPTMRIKVPYWEGKFNVELYDVKQTCLFDVNTDVATTPFESTIPKGSHLAAAIKCTGIWYAGGKFGVTWNLVQSIVQRPMRISGGCHISLSADDVKQSEEITRKEAEEAAKQDEDEDDAPEQTSAAVEDSDEEEEEAPPVVEEKPKKKRVVKRVVKKKE